MTERTGEISTYGCLLEGTMRCSLMQWVSLRELCLCSESEGDNPWVNTQQPKHLAVCGVYYEIDFAFWNCRSEFFASLAASVNQILGIEDLLVLLRTVLSTNPRYLHLEQIIINNCISDHRSERHTQGTWSANNGRIPRPDATWILAIWCSHQQYIPIVYQTLRNKTYILHTRHH
jgi:hypothetical protein